jgi:uncharacterized protein YbjT (DUF2867 family)
MYIVFGATGNVGSAVADTLLKKGQKVTVLTRNAANADSLKTKGASVAVCDVTDTNKLKNILRSCKRAFVLNPPAAPDTDTVKEEQKTMHAIVEAIKDSGIEKVVAESTYGARPGEGIGDLGVLYDLEQELKKLPLSVTIIRAAYYMSNWKFGLETADKEGKIYTLYPVDFRLPMADPKDIGRIAADLLQQPVEETGLHFVEGPGQYSSADVASAFSVALKRPVKAVQIDQKDWKDFLKQGGFSDKAADSMAAMTAITLEDKYEASQPLRGKTTLKEYIGKLVVSTQEQAVETK